jgi:hypothetical protein
VQRKKTEESKAFVEETLAKISRSGKKKGDGHIPGAAGGACTRAIGAP